MEHQLLMDAQELLNRQDVVIVDCRFSLTGADEGRRLYDQGHIPGACYLDLNRDMSTTPQEHGGRHPLPDPVVFAATLARCGIDKTTEVVAYDDSRLAMASRLWWMMKSLGYRLPRLLNGGYTAWLAAGGVPATGQTDPAVVTAPAEVAFNGYCNIDGLRLYQEEGAVLVDSREERRYQGLEEPIDPVAGHIPGAVNKPWQGVTDAGGTVVSGEQLRQHWGQELEAQRLVIYCGSGVSACVNLFSLALLGREDATLYVGSWSDWCSYL